MTSLYRQQHPDPGRTDLRQIEVFGLVGDTDIVRFREYPAVGNELLKFNTCDTWTLKRFWTHVSGPVIKERRKVAVGVYVDV